MDKKIVKHKGFIQLIKFGIVGLSNTLLTLIVIWVMMRLGYSSYLSNVIGYIVGLVNSYIWNSRWTFGSKGSYVEALLFILVFLFCYGANLLALWLLNNYTPLSSYLNQVIAMFVYNVMNFLLNKFLVFKK